MAFGLTGLVALLADEEGAAYHFGEFLGGLMCIGGVIGVVVFVKWALNPPRRGGRGGRREPGRDRTDGDQE